VKKVVALSEEDYNIVLCNMRDALSSLKREHVITCGAMWAESRLEEAIDILEKEEE
jgi:hypothetical protein